MTTPDCENSTMLEMSAHVPAAVIPRQVYKQLGGAALGMDVGVRHCYNSTILRNEANYPKRFRLDCTSDED